MPTNPNQPGCELVGEALEPLGAPREVRPAQIARPGRRAIGRVGHAVAEGEQRELLARVVQPRREPGRVQQPPEVVPRICEVGGGGGGHPAGVDAAKHDVDLVTRCGKNVRHIQSPESMPAHCRPPFLMDHAPLYSRLLPRGDRRRE